jgi:transposase-like protein
MSKQRYTAESKKETVKQVAESGYSVSDVAEEKK